MRAAWRRGDEVFAEVVLPDGVDAAGYGLHPALLDAAVQTVGLGAAGERGRGVMPFSWQGTVLHTAGATRLRVRLTDVADDTVSLRVWDTAGNPVASVDSLAIRPTAGVGVRRTGHDALFRTEWVPVASAPLPAAGAGPWSAAPNCGRNWPRRWPARRRWRRTRVSRR
ncbi:polyketide synthase dehydratase domain-containing protein [Micromonospora sp. R77]|uniref:polyketide synthase dehydratase domain-containing protein n=1 Tax=Micromonospora sp. R77 TaxID=2925836 RepID=UPI001F604D3F|nr:polyketide synthase dehydratase domain-containing protein [Micromonospora sp. R77]MCI4065627.1 polyketide synthase dehydratase domain-containing protein [Micromonospora sp. R77]